MRYFVTPNFSSLRIPDTDVFEGDLLKVLAEIPKGQTYLLGLEESAALLSPLNALPQWVRVVGCFDVLAPNGKNWLPINSVIEWGEELLAFRQTFLNVRLAAYIAGTGLRARSVAIKAVNAGFKKIIFVAEKTGQDTQSLLLDLRRVCFHVDFVVIERKNLTTDPILGCLLVTTIDPKVHPEFIDELAYLNFLAHQSLVIDLFPSEVESNLIIEAKALGLNVVNAQETMGLLFELLKRRNSTIS